MGIQTSSINSGPVAGFKNRIINGGMAIYQRSTGTVTPAIGDNRYVLDRYFVQTIDGTTNFSAQQSSVAPDQFTNSFLITTTVSGSPGSTDSKALFQFIEGNDVADLALGTAAAKSFTLSFWVRSSVTGTFGVGFANGAGTRSYTASYTISAANTWEYKTISVPGDTTGTWLKDNQTGLRVGWNVGSGSTYHQTPGSWGTTGSGRGAFSGVTSLLATAGATLYITGVQLEAGSVATNFEQRPIGVELALCQRYFQRWATDELTFAGYTGGNTATLAARIQMNYIVPMRTQPTASTYSFSTSSGTVNTVGYTSRGVTGGEFAILGTAGFFSIFNNAAFTLSAEM